MRKLILIAAMSLLASQAHGGGSRSLSLAAADSKQPATEQPAAPVAVPPQATQASPANVQTPTAPAATTSTTAAPVQSSTTPARTSETPKPKRRQPSVEARVIRELHRHGIYW
ncbi:hypothetical protein P0R31_35620 [Bradyrhizobium yuanmingense]|nr:hypothetical protein [Bradyrhizobium yuanmingense]MDF0522572.1 hypothetical protein [Bradyrhizobium yuanmingense]